MLLNILHFEFPSFILKIHEQAVLYDWNCKSSFNSLNSYFQSMLPVDFYPNVLYFYTGKFS